MCATLFSNRRGWIGSAVLRATIAGTGGVLAAWKYANVRQAEAAAASQPEPMEAVTVAVAQDRVHRADWVHRPAES